MASEHGALFVVSTPIGNLGDITLRAVDTLKAVDLVLAEDTRRTRALLSHLGIGDKRLIAVHQHTRSSTLDKLIDELRGGGRAALVTDAGTPLVSDPGADLVARAARAGVSVVPIPVTAAAAVSGLVEGAFTFLGFLPRKGKRRRELLSKIETSEHAVILFEAPARLHETLNELAARMPERRAVVCRELTKLHEDIRRGSLAELAALGITALGELTLVIASGDGARDQAPGWAAIDRKVRRALKGGESVKSIVDELAGSVAIGRRQLYARVQAIHDTPFTEAADPDAEELGAAELTDREDAEAEHGRGDADDGEPGDVGSPRQGD